MNTCIRKNAKSYFEKDFFKLMNNAVFGKTMGNFRKHRDIKLVATKGKRNYLVSEPNYHTTKFFTEHLSATEMKKKEILMNKTVNLVVSILELSNILFYKFWYNYVKRKCVEKVKLLYVNTDSFSVYIKTEDVYKDITEFYTSSYELECNSIDRSLPKGKIKKLIGLMKNELGLKIMTKLVGLRPKIYSYLIDDGSEDHKTKVTKNVS